MKKIKSIVAMTLLGGLLVMPISSDAVSGVNVDEIKIKVDAKHDGEWFRAIVKRTDDDGVLKLKNVLPGWYRFNLKSEDEESGQYLAVKLRMLDNDGRKLKEDTDVDLYVKMSGTDVLVGTVETDEDGWLEVENLSFDTEYKMEISDKDDSHVSKKEGRPRIKVKTKIDGDEWFRSSYKRTEKDQPMVFEMKNVLPGKYKFKYKSGDAEPTTPFILHVQMLTEKGKEIKEPTPVELYAYVGPDKVRTLAGTLMTDDDGWITVPGVMTHMKYKIKVKD